MRFFVLLAGALVVAGCQSRTAEAPQGPPPGTVRTSAATAPADLQLLCASEAATRFSVPSDNVLPVASSQVSPTEYQVDLTVAGSAATCLVDANGNIVSLA